MSVQLLQGYNNSRNKYPLTVEKNTKKTSVIKRKNVVYRIRIYKGISFSIQICFH